MVSHHSRNLKPFFFLQQRLLRIPGGRGPGQEEEEVERRLLLRHQSDPESQPQRIFFREKEIILLRCPLSRERRRKFGKNELISPPCNQSCQFINYWVIVNKGLITDPGCLRFSSKDIILYCWYENGVNLWFLPDFVIYKVGHRWRCLYAPQIDQGPSIPLIYCAHQQKRKTIWWYSMNKDCKSTFCSYSNRNVYVTL